MCYCICWTARSMERSIFFFLKNHISAPGERNCPNFFFYESFPIIFSCYKWFFVTFGAPSWPKLTKCVKKVPFWLSQAKITENDQPLPQLFRHPGAKNHTFRIFPAIFRYQILLEKSDIYDFLLQVAWTLWSRLVILFKKIWHFRNLWWRHRPINDVIIIFFLSINSVHDGEHSYQISYF